MWILLGQLTWIYKGLQYATTGIYGPELHFLNVATLKIIVYLHTLQSHELLLGIERLCHVSSSHVITLPQGKSTALYIV